MNGLPFVSKIDILTTRPICSIWLFLVACNFPTGALLVSVIWLFFIAHNFHILVSVVRLFFVACNFHTGDLLVSVIRLLFIACNSIQVPYWSVSLGCFLLHVIFIQGTYWSV